MLECRHAGHHHRMHNHCIMSEAALSALKGAADESCGGKQLKFGNLKVGIELPCPDSSSSFQARAPSHLGVCIIVQAVVMPSMTTFQQWLLLPACSSMPCYVEIFSYKSWSRSFPFQRHWSSHQRIATWLGRTKLNGTNKQQCNTTRWQAKTKRW